jgi:hypothetical protein
MSIEIPPGLRYLIGHGHAADGSHADNSYSTQHLVNPNAHNPTSSETVQRWIHTRVVADAQMRDAGAQT